ncbi:hypothetical protein RD792_013120 [Penstemon davidsonii]|uniref:Reverse transcriptase zinc-binding domain-containing protein n=1 Tax=Penstemon davidsonii TaxID=160366 RepID=A0ABR0CSK6_9LAMI|nr:hypothetical protein RD792_013120 [Penstemon davidsonii]
MPSAAADSEMLEQRPHCDLGLSGEDRRRNGVGGEAEGGGVGVSGEGCYRHSGVWDLSSINTAIPPTIAHNICSVPVPIHRGYSDSRIWSASSNGQFSCRRAYIALNNQLEEAPSLEEHPIWIWKLGCHLRLKFFLWLIYHKSLTTNALRFDRHFAPNDLCPRCSTNREDLFHIFYNCPKAKMIWDVVISPSDSLALSLIDSSHWIERNLKQNFHNLLLPECPWPFIFLSTIWHIWKARNKKVFEDLEVDSEIVVNLVTNRGADAHPLAKILEDVRLLMRKPWNVTFRHIRRTANAVADSLAKLGHLSEIGTKIVWDEAPPGVWDTLEE